MNFSKIILVSLLCIFFSHIAFADWIKQNSGTLAWLHSIYFADNNNGWIVGSNGTLLSTRDGGRTWTKEKTSTGDTFRDVYFSDTQNGWILCERSIYDSGSVPPSYMMQTSNGGKDWQSFNLAEGKERLVRLFFDKHGIGYAIGEGGIILRMQNDGKTWKKSPLPVRYLMLDGTFTDGSNGLLVGGGGTVLVTTDSGSTWSESRFIENRTRAKLNAVYFVDQKTGWAAGSQGKIYSTNDGGKLWREEESGSSVDLFDIVFVDSALGFAAGDNGVILRTTAAGANWKVEGTASKHKLERMFFAGNRGFAVGFGGTILTTELVRDSS